MHASPRGDSTMDFRFIFFVLNTAYTLLLYAIVWADCMHTVIMMSFDRSQTVRIETIQTWSKHTSICTPNHDAPSLIPSNTFAHFWQILRWKKKAGQAELTPQLSLFG